MTIPAPYCRNRRGDPESEGGRDPPRKTGLLSNESGTRGGERFSCQINARAFSRPLFADAATLRTLALHPASVIRAAREHRDESAAFKHKDILTVKHHVSARIFFALRRDLLPVPEISRARAPALRLPDSARHRVRNESCTLAFTFHARDALLDPPLRMFGDDDVHNFLRNIVVKRNSPVSKQIIPHIMSQKYPATVLPKKICAPATLRRRCVKP